MLLHRALERDDCEALPLAVEGQREVAAVLPRAYRFDVFHDLPEPVLDHPPASRPRAQMPLEGELQAFLAGIVHAGEADHVSSHFAARVVAPELAMLVYARQAERRDRIGGLGRQLPLEVN